MGRLTGRQATERRDKGVTEATKVEVEVGGYAPDGTFLGERLRFEAVELGSWTDYRASSSSDDRGTTYTLYRPDGGRYRIHEYSWSRWQGEAGEASLHPTEPVEDEWGTHGPIVYGSYTEEEARAEWPHVFAALDMPNVRDI